MSDVVGILIAPIIIFMIFVAPIWLIMHYRSKKQVGQGLNENEIVELHELARKAEILGERVKTLESILDVEAPDWRNKNA
ncbi:envelope stress response membrane protein PspB [Psychrosphaera sp. B3R10]|uniref:envelope stress response membrane protein PspB n=1 Tax=unclassified Psychrosphaera TaxID=2641570 RepID=UPI001C0873DE|nr:MULTISPECIES: envelope stress response membrane protein PspB [unclassified Psychrosphaera]MBU2884109.1 envelope stress response membrane protein PspB [Psychrosphaera sp. I2R16]MBU2989170.1 envelope stress response membrane protein PspB [Psychrosphaera sp. B3R10]MDO6720014.1 envelope stress response membrane protein PspB [Psychrosphaera sp. 1_MG-2023]